ncbi:MAG: polysaccharide biosynthesis tyrosine autokinase [Solirubrobacteraceae bacterium]
MTSEQSDIRTYLGVLWRWRVLVIAFVVAIPMAVYAYVSSQPKIYESNVLLQVQPLAVDTSLFNTAVPAPQAQTLLSAARLITTTAVAEAAAKELEEPPSSARQLLAKITATADVEADFITVFSRAGSGQRAAEVANAFAAAVVSTRAEQAVSRLNGAISNISDQVDRLARSDRDGRKQLSQQLQRLRALRAAQGNNARIVEPAIASSTAVAPRVQRTVVLSCVVALLLAFGAVVLAQGADRKIRDPLDLEELTDRPLLSAVPDSAFGDLQTSGAGEEAFQTLRASLTYFNIDRPIRSVLVSSPMQGDGKTTVATNLARAMALAGKDVILVDADLRRPQVASRFHVDGTAGLGGVLVLEASLEETFVEIELDTPDSGRLRALPAGPPPPNPSELLGSQRMKDLLSQLMEMADLVVVDSTPLLTVSDSLPLVEVVSGVVAVARLNSTSKDAIKRFERVITNAGGTLLGMVATGATTSGLYGRYGYGYSDYVSGRDSSSNGNAPSDGPPANPREKRRRLRLGRQA